MNSAWWIQKPRIAAHLAPPTIGSTSPPCFFRLKISAPYHILRSCSPPPPHLASTPLLCRILRACRPHLPTSLRLHPLLRHNLRGCSPLPSRPPGSGGDVVMSAATRLCHPILAPITRSRPRTTAATTDNPPFMILLSSVSYRMPKTTLACEKITKILQK